MNSTLRSVVPLAMLFYPRKNVNRDIFWQRNENRGCFTYLFWKNCQFLYSNYKLTPVISTEDARTRLLTYDDHPSHPLQSTFCLTTSQKAQYDSRNTRVTSDEIRWTKMNYEELKQKDRNTNSKRQKGWKRQKKMTKKE